MSLSIIAAVGASLQPTLARHLTSAHMHILHYASTLIMLSMQCWVSTCSLPWHLTAFKVAACRITCRRNCNNPLYSSKSASPPAAVIASAPFAAPFCMGPLDMAPLLTGAVTPLAGAAVATPLATPPTAAGRAAPLGATAVVEGSRRALAGVFGCKQADSSWKVIGWMAKTLVN